MKSKFLIILIIAIGICVALGLIFIQLTKPLERARVPVETEVRVETVLTLEPFENRVLAGEELMFKGKLVRADNGEGIPNATIFILDFDLDGALREELIATGTTDENGHFEIPWIAKQMDFQDPWVEIFAKFDGTSEFSPSKTSVSTLFVRTLSTKLLLHPLPSEVLAGTNITFSGRLIDEEGNGVSNVEILIFDKDEEKPTEFNGPIDWGKIPEFNKWIGEIIDDKGDDFLVSALTDDNGYFSAEWSTKIVDYSRSFYDPYFGLEIDTDGSVEIYAKFGGNDKFERSENFMTIQIKRIETLLTLNVPSEAIEGQSVILSGRLTRLDTGEGLSGWDIAIRVGPKLSIFRIFTGGEFSEFSAITDEEGSFSVEWTAKSYQGIWDLPVVAFFKGNEVFESSAKELEIHVIPKVSTALTLDPIPEVVAEGERLVIAGRLERRDTGEVLAGMDVLIFADGVLLTEVTTDADGMFSTTWVAKKITEGSVRIRAKFEGTLEFHPCESSRILYIL